MQYPLSPVHVLIYETIHPNTVLGYSELLHSQPHNWQESTQRVKELRLGVMNQFASANGTDALQVNVHSCQIGFINLINRLSYYITLTEQTYTQIEVIKFLQQQYEELQNILVSDLGYLQTHFISYFDMQQQVPSVVWMPKQTQWILQLNVLKTESLFQKCEPDLAFLIFTAIENRIGKEPYPNYQQYYYLQALLSEMEAERHTSSSLQTTAQVLNLLIRNNFNHPKVCDYYLQQLHEQIPDNACVQEKAECIALQLKACEQLYCSKWKWFSHYPSLSEMICRAVKQEFLFCYRKMKLNTLETRQTISASDTPNHDLPITTVLSVGQLAVMVRLLVECGLIKCSNHSKLMKRVANNLSTTKTAKISAESLRIKYYAPDMAAVNIAKEYIYKMLNVLKGL